MGTPLRNGSRTQSILVVLALLFSAGPACRRRGDESATPAASAAQLDVRDVRCIERPEGCIWCEGRGGALNIPEPDRPGPTLCDPKDSSECVEFCTRLASDCAVPWHPGASCLMSSEQELRRELFKLDTADRPEVVFQGRVLDDGGRRLDGAKVRIWFQSTPVAEETTGKDGVFRVKLRAGPWSYAVRVSRPGLASEMFEHRPDVRADRQPQLRTVHLGAEAAIKGRVTDGAGSGIAGVIVEALRNPEDPLDASEARTADDGSFVLGGLEANKRYTIRSSKFGWLSFVYKWPVAAPGRIGIKMSPTGVIEGEVVDTDGDGEPGAMVVALPSENFGGSPIVWTTDLEGRFSQDRFQVGTYYLWARDGEMLVYPPEKIELTPENLKGNVSLVLGHRGARVRGKVHTRDNVPLEPDTRVVLIGRSPLAMPRKAVGEVDRQGGFAVSGLLPGRYEVGFRLGARSIPIVRGPREVEIPIEAGARVEIAEPIVVRSRPEE